MPQCQVSLFSTMGLYHWPLIEIFHQVLKFNSLIHTRWIVLGYLGCHWHHWWWIQSLTSLMISLTLVNDIHYWLIVKWFLPCLTSRNLFTWLKSYHFGIRMKTLGWELILSCAFPRLCWRSFDTHIYILSHRSTLYCFVAMLFFHIVSP